MIQSVLLTRMLPSGMTAALVMVLVCSISRSEVIRSTGTSLAFLAGLAAGNWQGQLVPYLAIHPEDLGWYALFSATCVAVAGEIIGAEFSRRSKSLVGSSLVRMAVVAACATWLTEWPQLKAQPWIIAALAAVMLLNSVALNRAGQSKLGAWVPLIVGTVWCGSATMLLVLAHSARFADLAILPSCASVAIGLIALLFRPQLTSLHVGPAVFIPGLMLGAFSNTYSDIPWISFGLMAMAPVLLLVLNSTTCRAWFEVRPFALAIVLLLPCAVAVGLAARAEIKGDASGHVVYPCPSHPVFKIVHYRVVPNPA